MTIRPGVELDLARYIMAVNQTYTHSQSSSPCASPAGVYYLLLRTDDPQLL
ncbi:MAG: hypothetical protein IPK16_30790 [Anaerolineales bacterium]|nr:hypothetical protein [Anaerolineales bacterium]